MIRKKDRAEYVESFAKVISFNKFIQMKIQTKLIELILMKKLKFYLIHKIFLFLIFLLYRVVHQ